MGKTERKKELLASYRERSVEGGVCLVRCATTGRVWLNACGDVGAQKNRFEFAQMTKTTLLPAMASDFAAHGAEAFTFEAAEILTRAPDQNDREFQDDLKALEALCRERLHAQGAEFYVT